MLALLEQRLNEMLARIGNDRRILLQAEGKPLSMLCCKPVGTRQ